MRGTHEDRCKAVGPCPLCGSTDLWFNDVPLKAFCWGSEKKPHKEWSKIVPPPYNPYIKEELK